MKILILSVTVGQGHNSCGNAVMSAFEEIGAECLMLDTLALSSKFVASSLNRVYIRMTRRNSKILRSIDDNFLGEDHEGRRKSTSKMIGGMGFAQKVYKAIKAFEPDAIICTHVYSALILTHIRKHKGLSMPVIGINTDFAMAPLWEDCAMDMFVLACRGMENNVISRGIPNDRLYSFGIPIHKRFQKTTPQNEAREALGIADKDTVLLMGGSMGFGNLPGIIEQLDALPLDFQMLVVCGRNKQLFSTVSALHTQKQLHAYQFVDNIEMLMDASNLLLTKPGGLTVSECLAKRIPLVLLDPIPGIEQRNSMFLSAMGVAIIAGPQYSVGDAVFNLLQDQERLNQMLTMQERIGNPYAAEDLRDAVIGMIESR